MKKLSLLLATVLIFSVTNLNAQKFKYGHVDGNAVYKKMPSVQNKSMQDEYNAKATDYQTNEASLSDLIKEDKVQEIKSLGERIQKFQVSAQEDAIKKQKEMYDPIRTKFNAALKTVAKKYGYKFIIDKNALLYFDDIDDVSKLVEKELGIK